MFSVAEVEEVKPDARRASIESRRSLRRSLSRETDPGTRGVPAHLSMYLNMAFLYHFEDKGNINIIFFSLREIYFLHIEFISIMIIYIYLILL